MVIDLHCHSTASDGTLTPQELLDRALTNGVELLSITDHDTVAAYAALDEIPPSLSLVPGIELSTAWQGVGIHVVGLNVAPGHPAMTAAVTRQREARVARAGKIARRLVKLGLPDTLAAAAKQAGDGVIARPHFARALVELGVVKDISTAFRKYLGKGKAGDVKDHWAPLEDTIGAIRDAGGIAVLAHPGHYQLTRSKRRRLVADFKAAGGGAVEVISGRQDPALTAALAHDAVDFDLLASAGSDFHRPGQYGVELGAVPPLPPICTPVWNAI